MTLPTLPLSNGTTGQSSSGSSSVVETESKLLTVVAVLSVGSTLSTLVVALRSYCRGWILNWFGRDDVVMLLAQTLLIALAVIEGFGKNFVRNAVVLFPEILSLHSSFLDMYGQIANTPREAKYGLGRHYPSLSREDIVPYSKVSLLGICFLLCRGSVIVMD
jgi:hypothetical protein